MAKPAYSLVYAILIAAGLIALVVFNRLLSSDEAAPAAHASLQRNEATAREARDATADGGEKTATGERAESAGDPARPTAAQAETPPVAAGKDEEERK